MAHQLFFLTIEWMLEGGTRPPACPLVSNHASSTGPGEDDDHVAAQGPAADPATRRSRSHGRSALPVL
jgi:hypothetical protein